MPDNRTLLAQINRSQQAWGRLTGINPRTARRQFEPKADTPVLVNRLLAFFVENPEALVAFEKFVAPQATAVQTHGEGK